MAEAFVELGAEGFNHLVDRHWEKGYDKVSGATKKRKNKTKNNDRRDDNNDNYQNNDSRNKPRAQLPSPERERDLPIAAGAAGATAGAAAGAASNRRGDSRDQSLERQSETSERVTRAYENERDDPVRPVHTVYAERHRTRRDNPRMSHANGYAPSRQQYDRYDDDEGSDYDEREGRRQRPSGRGYVDERIERDYVPYDREVIETERYRGPARPYDARRMSSSGNRAQDGPYGAGAVERYRRSQNDVNQVSRRSRSRSRGRQDRYDRGDRDRSYSDSPSRSRSRGGGFKEKVEEHFDTSQAGLGAGLVGAVIGGLAGRQYGKEHKNRDIILGAIVGGLGANLAENKYKDWKEERREKEERYDGRSRSAMR